MRRPSGRRSSLHQPLKLRSRIAPEKGVDRAIKIAIRCGIPEPSLVLEQGAKRQGNLPVLFRSESGRNERAYRKMLRLYSMSSALL
jgi:hypothetical protein